jgi:hypothetical protein
LDAAENETLLFKTQLREGNILAWLSIAEARMDRPPQNEVSPMMLYRHLPYWHSKLA